MAHAGISNSILFSSIKTMLITTQWIDFKSHGLMGYNQPAIWKHSYKVAGD